MLNRSGLGSTVGECLFSQILSHLHMTATLKPLGCEFLLFLANFTVEAHHQLYSM
jgi:hypothetical protein